MMRNLNTRNVTFIGFKSKPCNDDDKFIPVTQVSSRTSNAPSTTCTHSKIWIAYSSDGRLFSIVGPQTAKARGPNKIVLVREMNSSRFDADRSCLRPGTDSSGSSSSARYEGAILCWHLYTSMAILKTIRWRTGSQWRARSTGVIYSYFLVPVTSRAAAFCTR